ncbi:oxysterol-binding protein-related protein 2A-like [Phalaenopsis equestris]|uniref:oxysterol-binding protein-related protein 2A-like n=1 Tax=Phalaenopsis equestris TaxID=78828 RepID=UPI0009E65A37|nr:oxysterol-binding protein-related protein 2A-like [Phalaenopsis equestris]
MQRKEMHPLCCISIDCPGIGDRSPDPPEWEPSSEERGGPEGNAGGEGESDVSVAGVLYKWTNFGKGWRSRWFTLRNGVLSYSKICRREDRFYVSGQVRIIGAASARLSRSMEDGAVGRRLKNPVGVVYLKIASFRESKSDDRRFYIFSPTKTLQLKTNSKEDRQAWIKALILARNKLSLPENLSLFRNNISFSTENLKARLREAGINEGLINDCELIMQTEFSEFYRQLKLHYEEHLDFIGSFHQQLEGVNVDDDTRMINDESLQLMKHEFSSSGHGKFSEYSTTESSDDVEKQELEELSDEEPCFFDTKECFNELGVVIVPDLADVICSRKDHSAGSDMMIHNEADSKYYCQFPHVERRKKMPDPVEKEKGVSLWSMIKGNVGKDLTRVCLPVYFNEPLSSLQKCFEDLEYSHLLDKAYAYGKMGNSLMRILNVVAFAVSGYASSDGRLCKPFNPLLGETYEADFPEKGVRFISEKVSHHPMLVACHCEGNGWKFWGDSNLKSKFWGQSIQLDPVGVLTLEFDDGEVFQWSKVTTTIYNLILGKVYCDHHGTMNIHGNRQYSCKLKFKDHTLLNQNPRQVQGFVEDGTGVKVATLLGKWDDYMYYINGYDASKIKFPVAPGDASLLWKKNDSPANPTRYNLTSFAITLNELTPGLLERLPPTDSRLRPDQRYLENGEYEKANEEKLRLEKRQRMSTKLQEDGWKPRWFKRENEEGTYRYVGGYWEARELNKWDECPNIFGESSNSKDKL